MESSREAEDVIDANNTTRKCALLEVLSLFLDCLFLGLRLVCALLRMRVCVCVYTP